MITGLISVTLLIFLSVLTLASIILTQFSPSVGVMIYLMKKEDRHKLLKKLYKLSILPSYAVALLCLLKGNEPVKELFRIFIDGLANQDAYKISLTIGLNVLFIIAAIREHRKNKSENQSSKQ